MPIAIAWGMSLLAGCHPQQLAPSTRPAPPQLPTTTRGVIEPDLASLPAGPASAPARPDRYRALGARDCQNLAIKNAPLADEIVDQPVDSSRCARNAAAANNKRLARCYAADEIRNRWAGQALEHYFKLAAAEGQIDIASEGQKVLQTQLAAAIQAEKEGLRDRVDVGEIRRQILEAQAESARLEAGIVNLNEALAEELALDPKDRTPLWPTETLRVGSEEPPVEELVATGLHYRPDLNLLRVLASDEENGGDIASAVLKNVSPFLGNPAARSPLGMLLASLDKHHSGAGSSTHRQIVALLMSRERQAEAEIRAAAATRRGDRAVVAARLTHVRQLTERIADLEKKVAAGVAGAQADLIKSRLALIKARSDLLAAVADWNTADVKLRQAMGLLVRE